MKIVLARRYGELQTYGRIIVLEDDKILMQCLSLELPDRGNQVNHSCIPEGIYNITQVYSPTKGRCFQIHDVPGRENILIHKGNYASGEHKDTRGCVLVGSYLEDINNDGNLDVCESTLTLNKLLNLLNNEFVIYIV